MKLTVNGVDFNEFGGVGCVTAGRYYSSDAASGFGPPPLFTSLENEVREVTYPGLHGITTKSFGERGLMISASLIYIDTTKALVMAMLTDDFCIKFSQLARYKITLPDTTDFLGCKLVRGGANIATWGPSMNAKCVAQVRATWRQYDVSEYGPNTSAP